MLKTWRDGSAKQTIIGFVQRTCDEGGAWYLRPSERVAVFDNDGTLWCEKPMPIQLDFIIRYLGRMAGSRPELGQRQPWKAAVEHDHDWFRSLMTDHYAGDDTNIRILLGGILEAYDGISVEEFERQAEDFLHNAQHPTLHRSYITCVYAPMLDLLNYLRLNGFSNYIVSGGGRDFMRPISLDVYGIPRERVIGSSTSLTYTSDRPGGTITHKAEADFLNDGPEKPVRIWNRTGRRPVVAVGNSNGDAEMLEFTHRVDKPTLRLLVVHDDAQREFAYVAGAEQVLNHADVAGWTTVSMKDDWLTIF